MMKWSVIQQILLPASLEFIEFGRPQLPDVRQGLVLFDSLNMKGRFVQNQMGHSIQIKLVGIPVVQQIHCLQGRYPPSGTFRGRSK